MTFPFTQKLGLVDKVLFISINAHISIFEFIQ